MSNEVSQRVFVAGHRGMVGSAIVKVLKSRGCNELILKSSTELDLIDQLAVRDFFESERPQVVYLAAAMVGGIHANNTYPADFLYRNLMIQSNVMEASHRSGVERLLFLGSSCIYPRDAVQPIAESSLLGGALESTNEPYAIAKIGGIKLCESYKRQHGTDYRSLMPTNLYGPGDNYHPENSHVVPALIRRFHEAKLAGDATVTVWGNGLVRREFLYVDDLARACVDVMQIGADKFWAGRDLQCSHVNVGTGCDITIAELATMIAKTVGFSGEIEFDHAKPNGTPRKLLDVSQIRGFGWSPHVGLSEGLKKAYESFLS